MLLAYLNTCIYSIMQTLYVIMYVSCKATIRHRFTSGYYRQEDRMTQTQQRHTDALHSHTRRLLLLLLKMLLLFQEMHQAASVDKNDQLHGRLARRNELQFHSYTRARLTFNDVMYSTDCSQQLRSCICPLRGRLSSKLNPFGTRPTKTLGRTSE